MTSRNRYYNFAVDGEQIEVVGGDQIGAYVQGLIDGGASKIRIERVGPNE